MIPEINLLSPAHLRGRGSTPSLQVTAAAVTLAVALGLVAWSASLVAHVSRLRHDLAVATQEVARLEPLARHAQELSRAADQIRQRAALLQQMQTQVPASQVLEAIRSAVPRDVGVTSVTVGGSNVVVEGYAPAIPPLERFMVELENTGTVRHVDLSSSQRGTVGTHEVVKFRITGDVVPHAVTSQKEPAP